MPTQAFSSDRVRIVGAVDPAQAIRLAAAIFHECYPDGKRVDHIDRVYAAMKIISSCQGAQMMQAVPRAIADDLAAAIRAVAPDLIRLLPPAVPADVVRRGLEALERIANSFGYGPLETMLKIGDQESLKQLVADTSRLQEALAAAKRRNAAHHADLAATRSPGPLAH